MYKIPANTLFLGKNLVFVPECHSTNDLALQVSQQPSTQEGTVVITNNQTAGRGQRGSTWKATPEMNFTFSIILRPKYLAPGNQFYLNIFTSLAILDYLKIKTDARVSIKWPNDVLANGKKICGILIENQIRGNQLSNTIVGIGLNINQKHFETEATSLCLLTGKDVDLTQELDALLSQLEWRYLQLSSENYTSLLQDYLKVMHWRNEVHVFSSNAGNFTGVILGLDETGRLRIETDNGVKIFDMKEVVYLR